MRIALTIALSIFLLPAFAQEEKRPYNLVCFEKQGIIDSLNKVVNMQQFLRNGSILRSRSCDFAKIPKGSTALSAGFHKSDNGFIFPLFRVRYSTTGQRMYAADGIFSTSQWHLSLHCGQPVNAPAERCIVPRSCEALDGFLSLSGGEHTPDFIVIPRSCRRYSID
jgi:hypothetical protein